MLENEDILYNNNIVAKFIKKKAHYGRKKIEKVNVN